MRKIVITIAELTNAQRDKIEKIGTEHGFTACFYKSKKDAMNEVSDAEIIFGNAPELARVASKLKWLCTPSAGINQFAADGTFASSDAVLTNSSGAYGVTISEHIVMLLLEILRRQSEYTQFVACKKWIRDLPVRSIYGARILMLGTGDLGCKACTRLKAFGPAKITGVNRSGKNPSDCFDEICLQSNLKTLLPDTDILICTLPGTLATEHMLNAETLALLPDGAVVINVGRGTVIDQDALVKELECGRLQAGLDVFEQEPIPDDDPIWNCPNLLITPHVAGNMTLPHTVDRIVEMFLEDLENYAAGKPLAHKVYISKGY